jgi:Pyridoxamine 5'-phosphate oxidase
MGATQFEAPEWESLAWMGSETVGRLCVTDFGYPLAFPINYRLVRSGEKYRVVFRAVPHSAVGRYEGLASLEVDQIDERRLNAWSVIVRGELRAAVGEIDLPDTDPLMSDGRIRWKVLDVTSISGRRFTSTTAADAFDVEWQPAAGYM